MGPKKQKNYFEGYSHLLFLTIYYTRALEYGDFL